MNSASASQHLGFVKTSPNVFLLHLPYVFRNLLSFATTSHYVYMHPCLSSKDVFLWIQKDADQTFRKGV